MALGGGFFTLQDRGLPGSYINFISAAKAFAELSQRGTAAMPITMGWGVDGEVFTVEAQQLPKESLRLFGCKYTGEEMKGIRELFRHTKTVHFYRLNSGGEKARNVYATAKYTGSRGNNLKIVVDHNEASTEDAPVYDVSVYFGNLPVDRQTVVKGAALRDNDYISFSAFEDEIPLTAGTPLTGGTDGEIVNSNYQEFLDKIEGYAFNAIGCPSSEDTIKRLFIEFTKRMRDTVGAKFQCVVHKYPAADHEGVVSVENGVGGDANDPALVYWTTGAIAGCAVNESCTNKSYDGEYRVDTPHTQTQLANALLTGKFILHKVGDAVNVLDDINTFISHTSEKNADFSSNQTIRVLDQIAIDIARLFNTRYLGKILNNDAGRMSFWNDIVNIHTELEKLGAIENYSPDLLTVSRGGNKKSVVVGNGVEVVNAMGILYMTVIVQ